MKAFEDITLEWGGRLYTVPARKIMPLLHRVEDVLTLQEMAEAVGNGKVNVSRLASAFAVALRFAGADVSDDEVMLGMFGGEEGKSAAVIKGALTTLLIMMVPPSAAKTEAAKTPAGKPPAAAPSSARPSRSRASRSTAAAGD